MSERVGVIGLGLMGKPMARNLVRAGFELIVHNRSRAVVDELCAETTRIVPANTSAEVASMAPVVITMLPAPADVERVVLGRDGVCDGMKAGGLLIDMSTNSPELAIRIDDALRQIDASAIDAPVSGGDKGAIEGTLSIMAGGSEDDFRRAFPIFQALGKTIVHCGGAGAGQTVKACNQIVVGIAYQAVSEALVLGSKAGVDPLRIIEVLNGGLAATNVLKLRGESMMSHEFAPGGRSELHLKDLGIALATGKRLNAPLPVTGVVEQLYATLLVNGNGHLDHSALLLLQEQASGHRLSESASTE